MCISKHDLLFLGYNKISANIGTIRVENGCSFLTCREKGRVRRGNLNS